MAAVALWNEKSCCADNDRGRDAHTLRSVSAMPRGNTIAEQTRNRKRNAAFNEHHRVECVTTYILFSNLDILHVLFLALPSKATRTESS